MKDRNPAFMNAVEAIRLCTFVEGIYCRPRFRADKWYNSALCPSPTGFWLVGKLEGGYQPSVEDLLCEWEVITAEGLKHEEPF